ncbi:hypothetical protein [Vibrio phage V-YDF132]|nr:hypothetical protein [Vibrio phage V-YDF132]
MTKEVVQSLVVDFTSGSNSAISDTALLRVESDYRDSTEGGLNVRDTPLYTDPYYLLVYSNKVSSIEVTVSSGRTSLGSELFSREVTEYINFDNTNEKMTEYPVARLHSMEWQGNDLGTPELTDRLVIKTPKTGVGMLKLVYDTEYQVLQLIAPDNIPQDVDKWNVSVVVSGEEIVEGGA